MNAESTLVVKGRVINEKNEETIMPILDLESPSLGWNKANWANKTVFNVGWRPDHVKVGSGGALQLKLDNKPSHGFPYSSGEYRTGRDFKYGRFEVRMKPVRASGVISSFFLYTGPSEGTPHDEIDIEFLGRNTRQVMFNYYTNGRGNNEFYCDLPFDAADDFHAYGFEWRSDFIAWYVDGQEKHRVEKASATTPLPSHAGKIMMNLWAGTQEVEGWLGPFIYTEPLVAKYQQVIVEP